MEVTFPECKVEITSDSFEHGNAAFKDADTVIVSFYPETDKTVFQKKYLAIKPEHLKKDTPLSCLDNCYISPEIFPQVLHYIRNNQEYKHFSAKNSFWKCSDDLDFSCLIMEASSVVFAESIIMSKKISFKESVFKVSDINFSNCKFYTDDFDFSNVKVFGKKISFNNSYFSPGKKSFKGLTIKGAVSEFKNIEFNAGNVNFSNADFGDEHVSFKISRFGAGNIDFSAAKFGLVENCFEKADFGSGDISFRASEFGGGRVNFISCVFGKGDKSFAGTKFGDGDVVFKNSKFSDGKVRFRAAEFGKGIIDFHYSEFGKGDLLFDSARFNDGDIDFRAVNFGTGTVRFKNLNVGDGSLLFIGCSLSGLLLVSDTVFGKGDFNFEEVAFSKTELIMENVDFGEGKVSFKDGVFKSICLSNSRLDNYFDLRVKHCEFLNLSETVVKDILNFDNKDITNNIERIDLSGMRLLGRLYLDWKRISVKDIILKQDISYSFKAEQFRILKENYSLTGQYDFEDQAYVEFKRAEAKSILETDLKSSNFAMKLWVYFGYAAKWLIFDKMGKFATDPLRVLLTMVVVYLFFSGCYLLVAEFGDIHIVSSLYEMTDPRVLSNMQKAFYHSAITFLTIGYGDYYPEGISRWISGIEGFVGLFLMAYFTVAFVRKVLR